MDKSPLATLTLEDFLEARRYGIYALYRRNEILIHLQSRVDYRRYTRYGRVLRQMEVGAQVEEGGRGGGPSRKGGNRTCHVREGRLEKRRERGGGVRRRRWRRLRPCCSPCGNEKARGRRGRRISAQALWNHVKSLILCFVLCDWFFLMGTIWGLFSSRLKVAFGEFRDGEVCRTRYTNEAGVILCQHVMPDG
jgi:hypothetical protein